MVQDGTTRIHTLATMFHMCVLQEEEDVLTFLDTWETYLEEATTTGKEISKEMKIGLLSSNLLESWNTFITMNSQGNSLSDLITEVRHENLPQQRKTSTPSMAMTVAVNRPQKLSYSNCYKPRSHNYKYTKVSNSRKGNK